MSCPVVRPITKIPALTTRRVDHQSETDLLGAAIGGNGCMPQQHFQQARPRIFCDSSTAYISRIDNHTDLHPGRVTRIAQFRRPVEGVVFAFIMFVMYLISSIHSQLHFSLVTKHFSNAVERPAGNHIPSAPSPPRHMFCSSSSMAWAPEVSCSSSSTH